MSYHMARKILRVYSIVLAVQAIGTIDQAKAGGRRFRICTSSIILGGGWLKPRSAQKMHHEATSCPKLSAGSGKLHLAFRATIY